MLTLNRRQVRQVDERAVKEYGMSSLVLMENAGRGVADMLCQSGVHGSVVICCGKGNNGGDGFVIARHLDLRGVTVKVLLFTDPAGLTGDAAANFRILEMCGILIEIFADPLASARLDHQLAAAEWIVDALLGTGAMGEPRSPYDQAIARINAAGKPVVAVDLPSGLDCDSGKPAANTIRAAHTCTFVAAKPGFFAPGAEQFTGQIHVLDIGSPRKLINEIVAQCGIFDAPH
jgi:NAD(P)H-hydrate epimerase